MVDTAPKVSVGMPIYNGERYISESIECILNQSFQDFELIICDNASTDQTEQICRRYQARDSRVRYFRNEENIGAAPNFNRTFEHSRGEFFAWVAHDDVYAADYLERLVDVFNGQREVVLVHAGINLIDEDGRRLKSAPNGNGFIDSTGRRVMRLDPDHLVEASRPSERFADVLHQICWCLQVFGLVRSDVLRETRLQRSYYGADKVLLAELALQGPFRQLDEALFSKRVHGGMSFFKSVKEKRDWIDPNANHRLPQIQMLRDYLVAVGKSGLGAKEKAACLWGVAQMFRRPGLLRRIFVPGPENYLGLDFSRSN